MPKGTNALVLSAGGIQGAFQAGAISELLTKHTPDGIFGSSAGALNGAFLSDRAGRQMSSAGQIDWVRLGQELIQFWQQRVTGPKVLWRARDRGEIAYQICRKNFRGVLDTEKLYWRIIREEITKKNLEDSGVDYHPGAVNLFSGNIEYPTAADKDIVDLIVASSAIPIAMDSVQIKRGRISVPFVDGGTRDVAPLSRAAEEGYTNIICVLCQSENLTSTDFPARTLSRLMSRLMTIIINETVNNDLKTIDRDKKIFKQLDIKKLKVDKISESHNAIESITIIRPDKELDYDDMKFGRKDIKEMINKGRAAAGSGLKNVFPDLETAKSTKLKGGFTIRW